MNGNESFSLHLCYRLPEAYYVNFSSYSTLCFLVPSNITKNQPLNQVRLSCHIVVTNDHLKSIMKLNKPPQSYRYKYTRVEQNLDAFKRFRIPELNIPVIHNIRASLPQFIARFLAGNESLKVHRSISRKRLALLNSGSAIADQEAYGLSQQINNYENAKSLFAKNEKFTITEFNNAHKLLSNIGDKKKGEIRTNQTWIGPSPISKATYVCPPPEIINDLLEELLQILDSEDIDPLVKALALYCKFLNIHPYHDGNGRVARALFEGVLTREYGDILNPLLYKITGDNFRYVQCVNSFCESNQSLYDQYWIDAFSWTNSLLERLSAIFELHSKELHQLIGIANLSSTAQTILKLLWEYPILTEIKVAKLLKSNLVATQSALKELTSLGVLEVRPLKHPQGAYVFSCPTVFKCWESMDAEILIDCD